MVVHCSYQVGAGQLEVLQLSINFFVRLFVTSVMIISLSVIIKRMFSNFLKHNFFFFNIYKPWLTSLCSVGRETEDTFFA